MKTLSQRVAPSAYLILVFLLIATSVSAQIRPCEHERDFQTRSEQYSEILETEPNNVAALLNRSWANWQTGNFSQAMRDISRAIELDPTSERAYEMRGRLNAHRANYDAAIADFTKALEINPKYLAAFRSRGRSYQFTGRSNLAIKDFEAYISIEPDEYGYGGLGISLRNGGRTSEANVALNKAIELLTKKIEKLDPNECGIRYYAERGIDAYFAGRYNEALTDLNTTIALNPREWETFFYRGLVHISIKANEQAHADFSKSIDLNPYFAENYSRRSWLNYVFKDKEAGDADLKRFKELSGAK